MGTTDDFTTSFLHIYLFSTALWDLANSGLVHSLTMSPHLFLCLPCPLPRFTVPCKMVLARPDERETCPYRCSLRLFTMVRITRYNTNFVRKIEHTSKETSFKTDAGRQNAASSGPFDVVKSNSSFSCFRLAHELCTHNV